MAFCTECGTNVPDDVKFCTSCGKPMGAPAQTQPVMAGASGANIPSQPQSAAPQTATAVMDPPRAAPQPAVVPPPAYAVPTGEAIPGPDSKYQPISTGGYIGIMLLMCIPIVGQILTIVWACGGCRKINKRNLARAMLVFLIISIVLGVVFYFVGSWLWEGILRDTGLGELLNEAGGLGGLSDALKELGELKDMIPTP